MTECSTTNAILPNFILTTRQNTHTTESGIDSYNKCLDKKHFLAYPYIIEYNFNSRGFRDNEWPENLTDAIWCIGDSFTSGLGSPINHTWVNVLQESTGTRCINISMDGASNKWIARKAIEVIQTIKPNNVVLQWSYLARDELADVTLTDEERRTNVNWARDDLYETSLIIEMDEQISIIDSIANDNNVNVIHSFIPYYTSAEYKEKSYNKIREDFWPAIPRTMDELESLPPAIFNELRDRFNLIDDIKEYIALVNTKFFNNRDVKFLTIIDYARDYHHYDIKTATQFVESILGKIK